MDDLLQVGEVRYGDHGNCTPLDPSALEWPVLRAQFRAWDER